MFGPSWASRRERKGASLLMFPFVPSKPLWSCFIPKRGEQKALGPKDAAGSLRRISSTRRAAARPAKRKPDEQGQENDARNSRCHTHLLFLPSWFCDGVALIFALR
jgi:hypothetical protein